MSQVKLKFIAPIGTPAPVNAAIASGDKIEDALNKLQGQINAGAIPVGYATEAYVNDAIAAINALAYKSEIDASGSPNYPSADAGHVYEIIANGHIGGASGQPVKIGDLLVCMVDGSAAGDEAAVGANWAVIENDTADVVRGPASVTDGHVALFDGATGKLIKSAGFAPQPLSSELTAIAGLAASNDNIIQRKSGAWTLRTPAQYKTDLALVKGDVGLGDVDNTSDLAKPISTATQAALNDKASASHTHTLENLSNVLSAAPTANDGLIFEAGSWNHRPLTKTDVGLANVDNTSDINKPISTATQTALNGKSASTHNHTLESLTNVNSTASTNGEGLVFESGSWNHRPLTKTDVGLSNVDNTSDANKPISTATQTALNGKASTTHNHTLESLSNVNSAAPSSGDGMIYESGSWNHRALGKADVALGNVDNTSDSNKPISIAQQAALDLKLDSASIGTTVQGYDAKLAAIAGVTAVADRVPYFSGASTVALATLTSFARTLLDDTSATTARGTLGLGSVNNTADTAKPVSIAQQAALDLKVDLTAIDTDVSLSANSDTKIPSQRAIKAYVDANAVSMWKDCGSYDASTNLWPSTGGTGSSGAVAAGNIWTISVPGVLGSVSVGVGDTIRALVSLPGQTASNWAVLEGNIGYVPLNKDSNLSDLSSASAAKANLGLGNVDNTSDINKPISSAQQTALDGKLGTSTIGVTVQGYDAKLAAIAGLTGAADRIPYFTGVNTAALATFTSFGRSLVDDADAATARTTLGVVIGTNVQAYDAKLGAIAGLTGAADRLPYFTGASTAALATFTSFGRSLVDDADATAARVTLGVVIGTNVQAYDAKLGAIAGLTGAADRLPYFTGASTAALATFTSFGRSLVDDVDASAGRVTLGLGNVDNTSDLSKPISTATQAALDGKSSTAHTHTLENLSNVLSAAPTVGDGLIFESGNWNHRPLVKADVGLSSVDNTSDLSKPISTATQSALDAKAAATHNHTLESLTNVNSAASTSGDGLIFESGNWNHRPLTKSDVGLANLDNTSDLNKPISTATQTALNGKLNTSAIGSTVQAYDAKLAAIAGLTAAADRISYFTSSSAAAITTLTSFGRSLIDDADATAARTTLGLNNVNNTAESAKPVSTAQAAADTAVQSFSIQRANHTGTQTASTISDFGTAAAAAAPVQSVAGKTGAVTLVKADVGLGDVNNTSDIDKPVSSAQQLALDAKQVRMVYPVFQSPGGVDLGSPNWVKLGTLYAPGNDGKIARVRITGHRGYNASADQNMDVECYYKTTFTGSPGINGFNGDSQYWVRGGAAPSSSTPIKWVANSADVYADTFEMWFLADSFANNSFYEVEVSAEATWTHAGTTGSDPGAASASVLHAASDYRINGVAILPSGSKVKENTTARASNATVSADPELQFAMKANKKYRIAICVPFTTTGTGVGIKCSFLNSGGTFSAAIGNWGVTTTFSTFTSTPVNVNMGGSISGTYILRIEAVVTNGGSDSTFQFGWSQNSSSSNATSVLAGSIIDWSEIE